MTKTTKPSANDTTILIENTKPQLLPETASGRCTYALYNLLTISATLIAPLYAYFLYNAEVEVGDSIEAEFNIDSNFITTILAIGAAFFAINNLLVELTSVNPVEEAEYLYLRKSISSQEETIEADVQPTYLRKATKTFSTINRAIAIPSFVTLSLSDVVSISYFSENLAVKCIGGTITTLLGVTYYNMFSGKRINDHSRGFIEYLFDKDSHLLQSLKSFDRTFEVIIEAASNMIYRSVAAAYISLQFSNKVLNLDLKHPAVVPLMLSSGMLTCYVTGFSRVMQVQQSYFNETFNQFTKHDLAHIQVSKIGIVADLILAATRGVATGWLIHSLVNTLTPFLRFPLAIGSGLLLSAHFFYVLYQKRRSETALANRFVSYIAINDTDSVEHMFDKIVKFYQNPQLERIVNFVNGNAGIARLIAFVGFILSIQNAMAENNIQFISKFDNVIALAALWGIPTQVAERKVFKKEMIEVIAYYQTKIKIGSPTYISNAMSALFYPKSKYEKKKLEEVLKKIECKNTGSTAAMRK